MKVVVGNLWDFAGEGMIVIPTNLKGVMGRGIAQQAKEKFPEIESEYKALLRKGEANKPIVIQKEKAGNTFILFPVKYDWKQFAAISLIREGLRVLRTHFDSGEMKMKIFMPAVGCGFGGLNFDRDLKPLLEEYCGVSDDFVLVLRNEEVKSFYPDSFKAGSCRDKSDFSSIDLEELNKYLNAAPVEPEIVEEVVVKKPRTRKKKEPEDGTTDPNS